jgi:TetR/AcrR family transcriptional repressor of bet genes
MTRPSNNRERRAQIVDGLARAMASQGYEGATVARIAQEAGLTPGLVHYHFESKGEVLLALADRLTSGARARIERRLARAGADPRRRLDAFLDGLLDVGEDANPEAVACWALIGAEAIRQIDVRRVYERWTAEAGAQLQDLLTQLLRAEGRRRTGVKAMAAGLLALVEGFFSLSAAAGGIVPAGSAAGVARRMAAGLVDSQPRERGGRP